VTTFALVHGAWHGGWSWDLLRPEFERRGHRAVAVDLPCDDPAAGCARYAEVVAEALVAETDDVVAVGHSLGGLTIPLLPALRPVARLVFLCALLPRPGRSLVDQLKEEEIFVRGFPQGARRDELRRSFWPSLDAAVDELYADCPETVGAWAASRLRPQAREPSVEPSPLAAWPDVPCTYVVAGEDQVIDPGWQRRAARERLGLEPWELEAGHSPFLTRPAELAALLDRL
jgi:pimeloyl-ACP methyl ester carboxylesterase